MLKQLTLAGLALLIIGCGGGNGTSGDTVGPPASSPPTIKPPVTLPFIVPLDSSWVQHFNNLALNIDYGTAKPLMPIADGLAEIFPTKESGDRFNYLCSAQHFANISEANSLSMTIRTEVITGTPIIEWRSANNNCMIGCDPGSAHLMIFGPPGDLFSTSDRWWADVSIPLNMPPLAMASLTVPLDGSHWTGVLGQSATTTNGAKSFLNVKKRVEWLCITFGGGFFQGHGLDTADGTMEFDLLNFQVD